MTIREMFECEKRFQKTLKVSKEDVWGNYEKGTFGMVVARYAGQVCPIFGDILPYKSVTVVFKEDVERDVTYWLGYVQGENSISKRKVLADGRIAVRSDYMYL